MTAAYALRIAAKTLRAVASLRRTRKDYAHELRVAADICDDTAAALELAEKQAER
jgi:hypothetical protein